MEWYTLKDLIVPFIGTRAMSLFSYSISEGNNCLICSTFFRKILIDSGDDPDNPILNETEKLLMDLGQKIAQDPHNIPEEYYVKLKTLFTQEQIVLLFSFAGIMNATNLFNIIGKVPLDEILYEYTKENKK
jgi:alkylhydroperoxidase family enzyme